MMKRTCVPAYRLLLSLSNELILFLSHYESPCILEWGQGTCTLTKHTRCWKYFALRYFLLTHPEAELGNKHVLIQPSLLFLVLFLRKNYTISDVEYIIRVYGG